jgi:hypothetical protein
VSVERSDSSFELELTRSPVDRRLYALEGLGTLRLEGVASRRATAEAAGRRWRFAGRGFLQRVIEATDEGGLLVGEFEPRTLHRGGTLRWDGRELGLRPASAWRERYALVEGDRELAAFDGKGWGKRPVAVTLADDVAGEPGLVLFAAFVVRGLAEDASAVAATPATSAVG